MKKTMFIIIAGLMVSCSKSTVDTKPVSPPVLLAPQVVVQPPTTTDSLQMGFIIVNPPPETGQDTTTIESIVLNGVQVHGKITPTDYQIQLDSTKVAVGDTTNVLVITFNSKRNKIGTWCDVVSGLPNPNGRTRTLDSIPAGISILILRNIVSSDQGIGINLKPR